MRSQQARPYKVRQQTSGYNGATSYIVVKNPGGNRVSVHAHCTRESAQVSADELNILDMVAPFAADPRPFDVRVAEAEVKYRELT